jgi:hypothetical protein
LEYIPARLLKELFLQLKALWPELQSRGYTGAYTTLIGRTKILWYNDGEEIKNTENSKICGYVLAAIQNRTATHNYAAAILRDLFR